MTPRTAPAPPLNLFIPLIDKLRLLHRIFLLLAFLLRGFPSFGLALNTEYGAEVPQPVRVRFFCKLASHDCGNS